MTDKNLIAQGLRWIKDKYKVTNEEWSRISGVPVGTIARYLSSSLNIPNFPYVCALIKCFPDESIDDFFDWINNKIDSPADALKLDAVPAAVVGDIPIDTPETKATMQERIIVQTEAMVELRGTIREKETEIKLLQAEVKMCECIIREKDNTIAHLEDLNNRKQLALQAICSAQ